MFQIQEEEKKKILLKLMNTSSHPSRVDSVEYYKVPFTDALDLVRQRKVYLQAGFAYIPADELVSIITASFRSHLSLAMTVSFHEILDFFLLQDIIIDFIFSWPCDHCLS